MAGCSPSSSYWSVRQLTHDKENHGLDSNDNFSPDDLWLVYDTRPNPSGIALNAKIEKVHVETGEKHVLYNVKEPNDHGPGVGAVSYHPFLPQVVFIHGLDNSNEANPYAGHRRTGVIIDEREPGKRIFMDSRMTTAPFVLGALRGGTHRHQWSGDGEWIGFTYNDAIMVDLEAKTGKSYDLRTVGVSKRNGPKVKVPQDEAGENVQGEWFSALVVPVVADPQPGSNEVSKAYEDWWVGDQGYTKADGSVQRARAFMGDIKTADGSPLTEVFIVDIPEDIHIPEDGSPLEGDSLRMPGVSKGVEIRRLTHTEKWEYPGIATSPRNWLTSSYDGRFISFLARDNKGIIQVFVVSPLGGEPTQVSFQDTDVQSMARWHPRELAFAYICDNSIFISSITTEGKASEAARITEKTNNIPFAHCWSRAGDKIAFNRYVESGDDSFIQIFLAEP